MIGKMCTFSRRLPMARSRIPAPRSPGNATRRNGASASSSHSASPSSPLLSSPRCSSASKCAGSHFFLRFEQSAQLDGLRPRFISGYWYLAEGDEAFLIGVGQGQGAGRGAPKRPWTCRSAAPLAAADPRRPGRPAIIRLELGSSPFCRVALSTLERRLAGRVLGACTRSHSDSTYAADRPAISEWKTKTAPAPVFPSSETVLPMVA